MTVWADTRMLWQMAEFGVVVHSRCATHEATRSIKVQNNLCYIMYAKFKLEFVDFNYASYRISTKICKSSVVSECGTVDNEPTG